MKNIIYPRAVLQTWKILCLYALAYRVKALRDEKNIGESGWMLSGEIAGGFPVDAVWLETHFQNTLSHPYAGIVNNDPLSAAWLRKIAEADEQPIAVVNSVLEHIGTHSIGTLLLKLRGGFKFALFISLRSLVLCRIGRAGIEKGLYAKASAIRCPYGARYQ